MREHSLPDRRTIAFDHRRLALRFQGLRSWDRRQPLLFRCTRKPEPQEHETGEPQSGHRPEAPLPHSDALIGAPDHSEPHDHTADFRNDPATDRVRGVPQVHLGGQLIRRNPEGKQLRTRRKACSLKELAENVESADHHGQCRHTRSRVRSLAQKETGDLLRKAERDVHAHADRKPEAEHLARIDTVADESVQELRDAVNNAAGEQTVAEHRFGDTEILFESRHRETEVLP